MPNCIINACSFRWRKKDPDVALHVFPKDMAIIRSWLLHINQDFGDLDEFCHKIFNSSKGTYRICSQHFTLDAYEVRGMVTFLKRDAVPTIFPKEEFELPTRKRRKKMIPTSQTEADASTSNLPFPSTAFSDCVKLEMPWNSETFSGCAKIEMPWNPETFSDCAKIEMPWNPETFSDCTKIEMPWNPETSRCVDLKTNHFSAPSVHSHIYPGQPEEHSPYESKPYRPPSTRTIGTSMDYLPGKVHQSTQLNKPMGTKDKNLQTHLIPLYRSVGIQCNLDDLPSFPLRSTVSRSRASRLCSYSNWTKLLQYQSQAYLHDDCQ